MWLDVFRRVARTGSFTSAGVEMGFTQSAVSRHIAALEREIGVPVFQRLARGVRLTEEGGLLLRHADAVADRIVDARREIAALRDLSAGRLRVGAFATADAALVPRAMAAFRTSFPGIALSLSEGLSPMLLRSLRSGDIDLAVVSSYADQQLDTSDLDVQRLLKDPVLIALPSSHRFADRRSLALAELADESWVAASPNAENTLISACLRNGFEPRIDFVVREWTAKLGFVAAGLGITMVPSLAAAAVRPDIAVVPLRAADSPVRGVDVVTPRKVLRTPAADAFIEYLESEAARPKTQRRRATHG
jgi:DNA-binding transcriptional LysR family regulator